MPRRVRDGSVSNGAGGTGLDPAPWLLHYAKVGSLVETMRLL